VQLQPPGNRTIQNFVKDYVDKYIGQYKAERHVLFVLIFFKMKVSFHWIRFFLIQGGLNLSSSELEPQSPNNRTIQNFVKDYVDEYIG